MKNEDVLVASVYKNIIPEYRIPPCYLKGGQASWINWDFELQINLILPNKFKVSLYEGRGRLFQTDGPIFDNRLINICFEWLYAFYEKKPKILDSIKDMDMVCKAAEIPKK